MKQYNILIWGYGKKYNESINIIKYQELLGTLKVVGIIDKNETYKKLDGYSVLKLSDINKVKFDYVLVTSDVFFNEICEMAMSLGIVRNKIVPVRVFLLPGFDFRKYVDLLNSKVSIIANLCWGGDIPYVRNGVFVSVYQFISKGTRLFEIFEQYKVLHRLQFKICSLGI